MTVICDLVHRRNNRHGNQQQKAETHSQNRKQNRQDELIAQEATKY